MPRIFSTGSSTRRASAVAHSKKPPVPEDGSGPEVPDSKPGYKEEMAKKLLHRLLKSSPRREFRLRK